MQLEGLLVQLAGAVAGGQEGHALQRPLLLGAAHGVHQLAPQAPGQARGQALDPGQGPGLGGRGLGQGDQHVVAQDLEGRQVALAGQAVAQDEQLAQDAHLHRREGAGALDAQEVVGLEDPLGGLEALEPAALALDDDRPPLVLQLVAQKVHQRDQVVGVQARVGDLALGQGSAGPVRALQGLVQLDPEALPQDRRQAGGGHPQGGRGHAGIEQVLEVEAVVPLEDQDVVLAVVEDLDPLGIGQHAADAVHRHVAEGVQEVVAVLDRDLDQAHPLAVVKERVGLGVDGDLPLALQVRQEPLDPLGVVHQRGGREVGGLVEGGHGLGKSIPGVRAADLGRGRPAERMKAIRRPGSGKLRGGGSRVGVRLRGREGPRAAR